MSQVIVTKDNLQARRDQSASQEHKIDREGQFSRWRRNDITGFDPIETGAGVAMAPVLAIWWVFSIVVKVAVFAALIVGKLMSVAVGKWKTPMS